MSVLSRLEQERHYIIRQDEVVDRFHRVQDLMPLIVKEELDPQQISNIDGHILLSCNISGVFSQRSFKNSIFMDCVFSGDFQNCDFSESDIIDGIFEGNFRMNRFTGSYIRRSSITQANFNRNIPQEINPDQAVNVNNKRKTGVVIFCAQVEKSMYQPENVAIFMPVQINLPYDLNLPFLARLYFDGTRKKLGLISLKDFVMPHNPNGNERIWSGLIYTLPKEQTELREIIINNMIKGLGLKKERFQILELEQIEIKNLSLRPARPLDLQIIEENKGSIHPVINECLGRILKL